jgi:hypothetical protein
MRIKVIMGFWLLWGVGTLMMVWQLKTAKNKFSPEKLNEMIYSISKFRDTTNDPCKYAVRGDPKTLDYVKIDYWCKDGRSSRSTLALAAIKQQTVEGVIDEYSRIQGLKEDIKTNSSWYCLLDNVLVNDWVTAVRRGNVISCYEGQYIEND